MQTNKIEGFNVHDLFEYSNGELIWRSRPIHHFCSVGASKTFNTRFAGQIAGTKTNKSGYAEVRINQRSYAVHRIIFFMFNGYMPKCIDHINMDKCDNRIENLRPATLSQNGINSRNRRNNTSGYKGVSFCKSTKKWKASIKCQGKNINIGYFNDIKEAAKARKKTEIELFGEFATNTEQALKGEG